MPKRNAIACATLTPLLLGACASHEAMPTEAPVPAQFATLVEVKIPAGVPRTALVDGFKSSVPTYQAVPGLVRKYYTLNEADFGGVYLWTDRAAAEAWYTPAWSAQCEARYGTECRVTYFDSPLQIEGAASMP
jgi:hypothetical protein